MIYKAPMRCCRRCKPIRCCADERVIEPLLAAGKTPLIPPKSNRKIQRTFDKEMYKGKLKQFRAIATRYDKTARNFPAGIQLAVAIILLN
jgi:hypothetical protein